MISLRYGAGFLFSFLVVSACGLNRSNNIRECQIEGPTQISIGNATLLVPPDLIGMDIRVENDGKQFRGPKKSKYTKVCPEDYDSVPKARQVSIYTPKKRNLKEFNFPVAVDLLIEASKPTYSSVYGMRDWQDFDLESASDGFVVTDRANVGMTASDIYIYQGDDVTLPAGDPLAIGCYKSPNEFARNCYNWFEPVDGILVSYTFSRKDYPISEWVSLHGRIEAEVSVLIVQ